MLFCIAVANTDGKVPSGCGDDRRFVPMAILLKALDALVDDAVRIWDFIMRCILVSGGVSLLIYNNDIMSLNSCNLLIFLHNFLQCLLVTVPGGMLVVCWCVIILVCCDL